MQREQMIETLREKLDRNWSDYLRELDGLSKGVLIGKSDEITAARFVYNELYGGGYPEDYMEYLLRFENPLEVARDQWISEQTVDFSEELNHALWSLMDKGDAEQDYTLDPEYMPIPATDKKVTVREFIEAHPNVAFDMMTPGGYVYLTPETAQLLLAGQSVKGNPGSSEFARDVPVEELLDQEVCDANFSEGAWHILSDYIREPEQEQSPFDQGVTMC
ncbi:hypothetical protein HZF24_02990 [Sedimentibacter hydroxybenzoicus DSM 7310]|uniref:DUF3848 domain-containing protein n=1 Tax=Sedimentibacter hydroxybenzoicus DSM 7310 TaxID=1123245 RepID=A0A974GV88_SEDHY|nr:hypothetical protein [Sedimentibacter hydroxybenzoicus]NYB73101.1 hypothetical protein [Sedimentibacter hydroxybenzoicus DSM 7310]